MRRKELGYNRARFILVTRFVLCVALAVWTSTCAAQVATKKSVAILDFENAAILSLSKTRLCLATILSGANALEISDVQHDETEARRPAAIGKQCYILVEDH